MVVFGVRRRSWLAVAAVLGLVASLLAVGSAPVSGVAGEADNEPVFSACVGPALESQGLVDVVGSFAEDAVNCLAHFEVTRGRTETTYDPGAPVLRWQMALFLARAAGPAGIALPANPDNAFTDTVGLFEEGRTAIAQMAQLRVMRGRSSTSFRPNEPVSRAEMAEMLDSFLVEAEKASGLGLGALGGGGAALSDVSADDEVFSDIGSVTRGQYAAVRRMFELGVARGTADGLFNPGGLVTRAQMAVFITRMLAHTAARPAGLTVQAAESEAVVGDSVELAVSVRDNDLVPMPDALVDVFSAVDPGEAFGEDGRCDADVVSVVGGGGVCEISLADLSTDPSGDLELSVDSLAGSTTVWAWTGDEGDRFMAGETVSSSVEVEVSKPGVKLRVTDDMPEGATSLGFGDRVVFTLQVVDEDGEAAAVEDVSVRVAVSETRVDAGSDPAEESTQMSTSVYETDASGSIELSFRQTDPRPGSGDTGDSARLDLDVIPLGSPALELVDETNLKKAGRESGGGAEDAAAVWLDSEPTPTALMLSQDVAYQEASKAGSGAAHVVEATLTDQYGNPIRGKRIHFTSDDPDGIGAEAASEGAPTALVFDTSSGGIRMFTGTARLSRTTNARGVASLAYNRKSDAPGIETILAVYEVVRGAADSSDDRPEGDPDDNIEAERIYHYWAVEPSDGASARGRLLEADTENNRLVFAGDNTVSVVGYDSNDQFTTAAGPALLDDFEKELKDGAAHVAVSEYQSKTAKVGGFTAEPEWPRLDGSAIAGGLEVAGQGWHAYDFAVDNGVIVAGAPFEPVDHDDDPATPALDEAGAVYIYESITDTSPVRLVSDAPVVGGRFGNDVDIAGSTVVVGEPGRHPWRPIEDRVDVGKLHVVLKGSANPLTTDTGWPSVPTFTYDDGLHNYGGAVAVSADEKTIGAVARRDWAGANHAKTWTRSSRFWNNGAAARVASAPAQPGTIGWPNSISIDEDGDTLVLGGPVHGASPNIRSGRAYVFKTPSGPGNWVFKQTLNPPDVGRDQRFGASVGIDDAGAAVVTGGAFRHSERKPGGLYVFTTTDDWDTEEAMERVALTPARPRNSDVFGSYVDFASDGSAVATSAHFRQEGDWRGTVFVFAKPAGGWADADRSSEEYVGPEPNKKFGFRVSFDRTEGDLYSAQAYANPEGGNFAPVYMIDR